jgi:hypothetical protein
MKHTIFFKNKINNNMRKIILFLSAALCFCLGNKVIAQTVDFGTTGSCTWTLTGTSGNYTLTISASGSGAKGDYNWGSAPWYS